MMQVQVSTTFIGEDKFEVTTPVPGVKIYVDKKKETGVPAGQNPLELFLSALSGCIGVYAKNYLARHEITFKKLKIQASAELSEDHPIRLVNIKARIETDADLKDKKDVFLKFVHNCPVHNTVLNTKEVDIQLV